MGTGFTPKSLWPQMLFGLKKKHQQLAESPVQCHAQWTLALQVSPCLPTQHHTS